jgi:O-antigen/teichoic acid export membrane protein
MSKAMTDRERIASDSRRRLPRVKVDVIVLVVLVVAALTLAPRHGLWGWVLALVAVASVGVVVGIVGRRYPGISGQRRRARRARRS